MSEEVKNETSKEGRTIFLDIPDNGSDSNSDSSEDNLWNIRRRHDKQ